MTSISFDYRSFGNLDYEFFEKGMLKYFKNDGNFKDIKPTLTISE